MKRFIFLLPVFILGCKTVPVVFDTPETDALAVDTIVLGKGLESTISDIKAITDDAKQSGNINQQNTAKIIEYVDSASVHVKDLNAKIIALEKSRASDNETHAEIIGVFTAENDTLRKQVLTRNNFIYGLSIALAIIIICVIIKLKLPP